MEEIQRKMLVEFADKIKNHPDVERVNIDISFKDGSNIHVTRNIWEHKKNG